MYSNESSKKKYIRCAKHGIVLILSLLCISGLFLVNYQIGLVLAFFLSLKLFYLCHLPYRMTSDAEASVLILGLPLYFLKLLWIVYPNFEFPLQPGIVALLIVIAFVLSCIDFAGIIAKTAIEIPEIKDIISRCVIYSMVLLMFCWGAGTCILPHTKTVEEAYVSQRHKERTYATKGPEYKYHIEYVGVESNQRADAEVSATIYNKVTPIMGHIYVSTGQNIFGKTITAISLTNETNKTNGIDLLIGVGMAVCSVGASYVHHTIYIEILREEELKRKAFIEEETRKKRRRKK